MKGTDCTPAMNGPWTYVRIINSEFSYNCNLSDPNESQAGGFAIQGNQSGLGGEATSHIYAPSHMLLDHDYFHDYVVNGCGGGHQDCIHIYAWTDSTISNSKFDKCYDSSILAEGLDEAGYAENDVIENNWFGPTVLGANNCCFRGDTTPSNETFDGWTIRFNSTTDTFMNKTGNVLNNVSFIGNVGLGTSICQSGSNVIYAYNMMGSAACGGTDTGGITNSQVKFTNISNGSLDLHLQAGSAAIGKVPLAQAGGCAATAGGKDMDGDARTPSGATACDAGADEYVMPGNVANLWVDTNGGTCTRSASPAAYNDAAACGSLNTAYQAAQAGDTAFIKAGTYVNQAITAKTSSGPAVLMQGAPSESAIVKELDIDGANWLTLKDFVVQPQPSLGNNDKIIDIGHGNKHVTLDNVDLDGRIGGTNQNRDGLGISGDTDFITIKNSDIGHNIDAKLIQIQTFSTAVQNTHLTLFHNDIHDDPQSNSAVHLECLWLEGISDFTLDSNHFYDCALNGILANADEGGTLANWHIVNNIFEMADAGVGGIPQDIDGCAETQPKTNWLIEYNFFSRGLRFTGGQGCTTDMSFLTARANIGASGDADCSTNGTWLYNIWVQKKCSATDVQNANILADANFVAPKAAEVLGAGDYHPSSGTASQVNTGDPVNYPPLDADGNIRPSSARADAGPYEFASGGTSVLGDLNSDSHVTVIDLSILLSHYGQSGQTLSTGDCNNDGAVTVTDLSILLSHYGS
jgi:hypothetical protein